MHDDRLQEGSMQRRLWRKTQSREALGPGERLTQAYRQTRTGFRRQAGVRDRATGRTSDPVAAAQRRDPEHMARERADQADKLGLRSGKKSDVTSFMRADDLARNAVKRTPPATQKMRKQASGRQERISSRFGRAAEPPLGLSDAKFVPATLVMLERMVGVGHPIMTNAMKVVANRMDQTDDKKRQQKLADRLHPLVKGIRRYENRPLPERVRKETTPARPIRGGLTYAQQRTAKANRPATVESSLDLSRSPLISEVVAAIAVGPSPHVRPDLIGKTIAGGKRVSGATTTADVGLRSKPSGFAVGAHKAIVPPGRYKKRGKKKKKRGRRTSKN